MPAPQRIVELVKTFERGLSTYKSSDYNEANVQKEFIEPFLEELGWDVSNKNGHPFRLKDVVVQRHIKDVDANRIPDYSIRVSGKDVLFVEAKRPSVNIHHNVSPAYQVRRYSYSAHLPLGVLTDFEELAVYDTISYKPRLTDRANVARVSYYHFTDYVDKWDEIAAMFSREAVIGGSLSNFANTNRKKRGTEPIDKEFLNDIEEWRNSLARNIALRNVDLSQQDLNFAVQRTIDRIIFLRICEARHIEHENTLLQTCDGTGLYRKLLRLFDNADAKYNSGLFHFSQERGRDEKHDAITKVLDIDDAPLRKIIKGMYYPDSPYEYSVLPADILGQVYEQFLGKVIRLTKSHQAKIEEKPDVRKAGGVYYTPTYVVDFIIDRTLGKLLEGKSPRDIGASDAKSKRNPISILDPACGSGSFLIVAYQRLLDWYLQWYISDGVSKHRDKLFEAASGDIRLTTSTRKRILLDHIYGVDIDPQAVEVTKLSLLLKVLEGENDVSIGKQLGLLKERALPDLGNNIKCGNSLIGHDFFDSHNGLFDDGELSQVNAFNWSRAFVAQMKFGGFDIVIGNPPWVDIKGMGNEYVEYYFNRYKVATNRINLYALFMELGLKLVCAGGMFGFITPSSLLTQSSYGKVRKLLRETGTLNVLVKLPDNVFEGVTAETAIFIYSNSSANAEATEVLSYARNQSISSIDRASAQSRSMNSLIDGVSDLESPFNIFVDSKGIQLLSKIELNKLSLSDVADFSLGLTPYDKYKGHTPVQIRERVFHSTSKESSTHKRLLAGNNIQRYLVTDEIEEYINYGPWLGAPRDRRFFSDSRVIVRQIVNERIYAVITSEELYFTQIAFGIISRDESQYSNALIAGIMNSKLMTYYHRNKFLDPNKATFQKLLIQDAKQFPIPMTNSTDASATLIRDLCALVMKVQATLTEYQRASSSHHKEVLKHQIDTADSMIDEIVYTLYGLNQSERALIEASFQ